MQVKKLLTVTVIYNWTWIESWLINALKMDNSLFNETSNCYQVYMVKILAKKQPLFNKIFPQIEIINGKISS